MEHFYHQLDGWFDFADLYERMVKEFPSESHFVEIGSWPGKSATFMAVEILNSRKNIKFDCIDLWPNNFEQFNKNISPVRAKINPIRSSSWNAMAQYQNESIDFIFIDACHDYFSVLLDIKVCLPKLKRNGILAGHDYSPPWPGVIKAVDQFFGPNKEIIHNSWLVRKKFYS